MSIYERDVHVWTRPFVELKQLKKKRNLVVESKMMKVKDKREIIVCGLRCLVNSFIEVFCCGGLCGKNKSGISSNIPKATKASHNEL